MLTTKKKEYLRKWLTKRLNELLEGVKDTSMDTTGINDKIIDKTDQAFNESDRSLKFRIKDRESKLIVKIKGALDRLEEGIFGICEECGEEIPEKRLIARPVASLCIECKRKQEFAEKVREVGL